MKSAKFLNLIVLGLVLTVPFAGCKRKTQGITPLPSQRVSTPIDPERARPILPDENVTSKIGEQTLPQRGVWDNAAEDREKFKSQTVYFDFDSAVVKASEKMKTEPVAAFLSSNPMNGVKIEGHCDERGTEEYNRSLGERRALAVREALIAAGIAPDRIVTISYGEDKPAAPGHDEAAYKMNRRGEFILLTPR